MAFEKCAEKDKLWRGASCATAAAAVHHEVAVRLQVDFEGLANAWVQACPQATRHASGFAQWSVVLVKTSCFKSLIAVEVSISFPLCKLGGDICRRSSGKASTKGKECRQQAPSVPKALGCGTCLLDTSGFLQVTASTDMPKTRCGALCRPLALALAGYSQAFNKKP